MHISLLWCALTILIQNHQLAYPNKPSVSFIILSSLPHLELYNLAVRTPSCTGSTEMPNKKPITNFKKKFKCTLDASH
jgi:hypothetical protein